MWRQRSRLNSEGGDKNTTFFHGQAILRKKKNTIKRLKDKDREWNEDKKEIEDIVNNHFKGLLSSSQPTGFNEVLSRADNSVNGEINHFLSMPFTTLEVKEAVFQMGHMKFLGSDGLPAFFCQKF